jgi:hypothetical protein
MQKGDLVFFSSAGGENELSIGDFVNKRNWQSMFCFSSRLRINMHSTTTSSV